MCYRIALPSIKGIHPFDSGDRMRARRVSSAYVSICGSLRQDRRDIQANWDWGTGTYESLDGRSLESGCTMLVSVHPCAVIQANEYWERYDPFLQGVQAKVRATLDKVTPFRDRELDTERRGEQSCGEWDPSSAFASWIVGGSGSVQDSESEKI
jgi:hypothetical protein